MGEELHEIVQNSSNEEYRENKQSDGSNVERDKEGDETEESAVQGDVDGRKNKKLPLLHVQSIRIFHISLEENGGKSMCCYQKETMRISKVVQLFTSKKMVEEHCSVHSIKICKGSSCIAALSLSFGIKGRTVLNTTPYHFTTSKEPHYQLNKAVGCL